MSVKSNISVYHDFTFYILHFTFWLLYINKISHGMGMSFKQSITSKFGLHSANQFLILHCILYNITHILCQHGMYK